jgi:hypothetical protein
MKVPNTAALAAQKPIDISAEEFLSTIFPEDARGKVGIVNLRKYGFCTLPWALGEDLADTTYVCISTLDGEVWADKNGNPRPPLIKRLESSCVETCVVFCDDVGTAPPGPDGKAISKVDPASFAGLLAPTGKLETSPDNYQYVYVFKDAVDPAKAAALVRGMVAAGLSDAGAQCANRVMRVPGAINRKRGNFVARLVEWHPERLYSYEEVRDGLKVTPIDKAQAQGAPHELPDGMLDPVFEWLAKKGRVLSSGPNARGAWDVRCPQDHLHTAGKSDSTSYWPGGGFHCLHGHCAGLTAGWLRKWILEQDPGADLSPIPREALQAIGVKLAGELRPMELPDGTFVAGETKGLAEAILSDLVHIASTNEWWSYEAGAPIKGDAVDTRWRARMLEAGLLVKRTPTGRVAQAEYTPTGWISRNEHMQKANKIVHRLGAQRLVEGDLNIAPALPKRAVSGQHPEPWLDLVSFVCNDVERDTELVLDWLAMLVTAPTEKPGWHLLLKGEQGTGKNMILDPIKRYLGDMLAVVVGESELASGFTTFLSRRLVQADELVYNTKGATTPRDMYNKIKAWTARGTGLVFVNDKNMKIYSALDLSCWVITSNAPIPLPLERGDRRIMAVETPRVPWPDEEYGKISRWLEHEGGNAAVVAWLHRRWDAMPEVRRDVLRGRAPDTEAKRALIKGSSEGIEGAIRLAIEGEDGVCWPNLMTAEDVMAELKNPVGFHLITDGVRKNQLNLQRIGLALRAAGAVKLFGGAPARDKDRKQYNMWCLRPSMVLMYEALGQGEALIERYRKERTLNTPFSLAADRASDD